MSRLLRHPVSFMLWIVPLFSLQGVPHTGGLRTLFLLIGISHLIGLWRSGHSVLSRGDAGKPEKVVFWLLTGWLVFHSIAIAGDPAKSVSQVAGDWGKLWLMALLGIVCARLLPNRSWLSIAFFAGAFLHVIEGGIAMAASFIRGGDFRFGEYAYGNYALTSSFVSVALAFLLADLAARFRGLPPLMPWRFFVSMMLASASLFVAMFLQAKSGQVAAVILVWASVLAVLVGKTENRHRGMIAAVTITTGITLLLTMIEVGGRWDRLDVSIRTALDGPIPVRALVTDAVTLPEGLDHSLYVRAIRYRVGIEGVVDHPLGLGFVANAFEQYVTRRFDLVTASDSSNSGLLDFGLATGLPGLLLLLALAFALIRRGWVAFMAGYPEGLALSLLVLQHIGRYAMDGTLAGSRFTGIAFAIAGLWALSISKTNAPRPS